MAVPTNQRRLATSMATGMQKQLQPGNMKIKKEIADNEAAANAPALDDFRHVKRFNDAFAQARKSGLKAFRWGKGVYGTQLASEVNPTPSRRATGSTPSPQSQQAPASQPTPNQKSNYVPVSPQGPYRPTGSTVLQNRFGVTAGNNLTAAPDDNPTYEKVGTTVNYPFMNTPQWDSSKATASPRPNVRPNSVSNTIARANAQNTVNADFGINKALRNLGNWASGIDWNLNKPRQGTAPKPKDAPGPILPESGKKAIKQAAGVAGGAVAGSPFMKNYVGSLWNMSSPTTVNTVGASLQGTIGAVAPGYIMHDQATKYANGGKLDDKQKAFVAYLIEVSGAQNEEELNQFVQELGEDGLQEQYQKFEELMTQGTEQVPAAAKGAKLNYIKT